MKLSEYTGPKCPTCGGPLWRRGERATMNDCRLCYLERSGRYARRMAFCDVGREWRGREAEANAWCFDDEYRPVGTNDPEARRHNERMRRPRAILEPGPEPGSAEARALMREAAGALYGYGNHDDRAGHTRHEVDAAFAHICPPASRTDLTLPLPPLRQEG